MRRLSLVVIALAVLTACESGTLVSIDIAVDDAAALRFSSDEPGVVVADATSAPASPVAPACGQTFLDHLSYTYDLGFGCLDDKKGTTETLRAWIAPIPGTWDKAAFCGLEPEAGPLAIPTEVTADPSVGAEPPDGFPFGEGEAEWKRDGSPCGGAATGEVDVRQAR
jgi:hypothetical protein